MESSVIREYTDIEPHESLRVEEIKLEPEIKYDTFYEEEEEIESGLSHKVKCEGLHKVNQETSQRVKIETGELASSQKMSNEVKIEIKDDIETEVLHDREVRSEVLHEVKTETFQNTNFTFCHVEIKSEPQYDETQFNLSCWEDYKDSSCIPNYSQELQKNIQGIKLENIDPHKLRKKQSDIRRKFNCDDCGTCFGLKQNLRRHVELNFCTEKFCVDCGKFFNRKESLENHMIRTHNKTLPIEIGVKCYECDVCKNRFVDKLTLETHVLEHKERKPLICHLCEKHFIRRYTFHRHLKMHNALKYKCDECNIGFSHKTRLIEHSAYHRALRPYQCAFCDKCFKEKAVYERHVNLHKGIRSFHCTMCNKLFTDNWILKRHLLIHQGIKYYCGECDRDFKCKGNLRLHLLTHEGERTSFAGNLNLSGNNPQHENVTGKHFMMTDSRTADYKKYECQVCHKRFSYTQTLSLHMKGHRDRENHYCAECGKVFTLKRYLDRHMAVHNKAKIYNCSECPKSFSRKDSLKRHFLTHKYVEKYECIKCEKVL